MYTYAHTHVYICAYTYICTPLYPYVPSAYRVEDNGEVQRAPHIPPYHHAPILKNAHIGIYPIAHLRLFYRAPVYSPSPESCEDIPCTLPIRHMVCPYYGAPAMRLCPYSGLQ
jgi:hypothetical protein